MSLDLPSTRQITIRRGETEHTIELEETESYQLLNALRVAWGWQGTMFSREDFSEALEREITDKEWDEINGYFTWYETVPDHLTEVGWDIIYSIIRDLGLDKRKETVVE